MDGTCLRTIWQRWGGLRLPLRQILRPRIGARLPGNCMIRAKPLLLFRNIYDCAHRGGEKSKMNLNESKQVCPTPIARPGNSFKPPQSVAAHLQEVAQLTSEFASPAKLEKTAHLCGLLHDFGKNGDVFQQYIVDPSKMANGGDHSSAGAKLLWKYIRNDASMLEKAAYQMLSICIVSHHGGLIDSIRPDGVGIFFKRITKNDEEIAFESSLKNCDKKLLLSIKDEILQEDAIREMKTGLQAIHQAGGSAVVSLLTVSLWVRFLFSSLVDADRMSAAGRMQTSPVNWKKLSKRLQAALDGFSKDTEVNRIRHEISETCANFALQQKGMYKLSVPTGGGKTLSSLRFALKHAELNGMSRIIYVIPYTSIIEQNAQEVRKILEEKDGPPIILEHHSNVIDDTDADGVQESTASLLSENWDAPIIFTTSVQFLNALFDGATGSARRMHRLGNSVVILDEVQTIPVRTVHLFNVATNFLVKNCGSTLVMCTATQPLLDEVDINKGALSFTKTETDGEIVPPFMNLSQRLRRVKMLDKCTPQGWSEEDLRQFILEKEQEHGNFLAVTNTKSWAKKLYTLCAPEHEAIFHLSAAMCPAHRSDILSKIKERIRPENQLPTICISTQLIEAGVDVDFNSGLRFLAGLDSMAQTAGRINRNGLHTLCYLYIVNPVEERIDKLIDIRIGKEKAARVLREFADNPVSFDNDLLSPKLMRLYYQYYFHDRAAAMDYRINGDTEFSGGETLLSLLSENLNSVREYIQNNGKAPDYPLRQSFKTAGQLFQALHTPTTAIVVPYSQEGKSLIEELKMPHSDMENLSKLLRRAQRFSVNLYPHEIQKLNDQRVIRVANKEIDVLILENDSYYDDALGVVTEPTAEMPFLDV